MTLAAGSRLGPYETLAQIEYGSALVLIEGIAGLDGSGTQRAR